MAQAGESACVIIACLCSDLVGIVQGGASAVGIVAEAEAAQGAGDSKGAVSAVVGVAEAAAVSAVGLDSQGGSVAVGIILVGECVALCVTNTNQPVCCIVGQGVADGGADCGQDVVVAVIAVADTAVVRVGFAGQALQCVIAVADCLAIGAGAGENSPPVTSRPAAGKSANGWMC